MNDSPDPTDHPANANQSGPDENDFDRPPVVVDLGEPPVVTLPGPIGPEPALSNFQRWIDESIGPKTYGAPRVFDLFTMLAITLAFALLFTLLRLLVPAVSPNGLAPTAIAIGAFVSLLAIAQMWMWKGDRPRLSSLIAGPPIWILISLGFTLQNPALFRPEAVMGILCSAVFGLPAGYLGGALVGGVFLLAEVFRSKYMGNSRVDDPATDDAIWNDSESTPET